ncbi:MAG TPA: hypothetical protein VMU16_06335 [Candidatus Binataceae bacterium]|nr:hypothetical protein [Candidatus Binataceae bacterium]
MTIYSRIRLVLLVAAVAAAGCSQNSGQEQVQPIPSDSGPSPHIINDLSSMPGGHIDPLAPSPITSRGESLMRPLDSRATAFRAFQETPGLSRPVGEENAPGQERLLNAKAAKFANFSQAIMDHIYSVLEQLESTDEYARIKVPVEIQPVVLTAIMTKDGVLKELILERHSGHATIDKLFITACKRGMWFRNPPVAALSDDGTYRMKFEGRIENYASMGTGHWTFKTSIGLGLE